MHTQSLRKPEAVSPSFPSSQRFCRLVETYSSRKSCRPNWDGAKIIAPGLKQHSGSMPTSDVRPQLSHEAACTLQEFSTFEQIALDAPCRANRPRRFRDVLSQTGVHVSLMNIHEAPGSQEPVRANSASVTLRDASLVMCLLDSTLPATASWRASNQRSNMEIGSEPLSIVISRRQLLESLNPCMRCEDRTPLRWHPFSRLPYFFVQHFPSRARRPGAQLCYFTRSVVTGSGVATLYCQWPSVQHVSA